jgi:hypothetical protein
VSQREETNNLINKLASNKIPKIPLEHSTQDLELLIDHKLEVEIGAIHAVFGVLPRDSL